MVIWDDRAMADFTHLHVHSAYSFLDGAIHMKDLCPRIDALGMKACAVTDHGNMFGAIDFYRRAKSTGLKPILGCEVWVAETSRLERPKKPKNYHLVLLAQNEQGYKNLMYLVSMGWREGFYYKPRIDKELLKDHTEGLIGLSGCLGGEVPNKILHRGNDAGLEALREHAAMFAKDRFFLELQHNGRPEQDQVNDVLKQMAADEGLPLVATNNCHYMMRDDAPAHDVLTAIQFSKSRNDPTRMRRNTDALYVRSPEEMIALFRDCPEAIDNTQRITEMIDLELNLGQPELPNFRPPGGQDLVTYLREQVFKGLEERYTEMTYEVDRDRYDARLKHELDIIIGMKFPGYFLIVADFINWAKENDIPVGPGRGSGAGSLVAYCLRITDIDPLPYNLLFERFLNPERVSMPDFDVDFCQERRGEVIDYVTDKYGATRVGQIATYAQMKAKSVIKDVARCLELPFNEVNALTKLLPAMYKDEKGSAKPITIDKALEIEPQLRQLADSNETYAEVIEIAKKLENLYRQAGMHAAGIVIGNDDLWNIVPIFKGNADELVTQFSMVDVEDAGLVKFDFLGLKTLDVIYHAERHVNERIERELNAGDLKALWAHQHLRRRMSADVLKEAVESKTAYVDRQQVRPQGIDLTLRCGLLPLEDPDVYKLIGRGETLGVFQLESTGFQELLKRLKPDCFEDIVAAVALYRPGPLQTGMVDDFIDCKHGRKQIEYPHPTLEDVLKPTYGGFVYQEQVMQAAQVMAGYSLGGADLLRRAMGKKKMEVMAKERVKFVAGCGERSIPEPEATRVFDLMEKFAGYGFNKSHSAAYALVTFHTAYLKCYYPVEFMAALLSTEVGSTDNIVKYIAEARSMSLEVLPPSVNEADKSFTVPGGKIRFGLSAIKGLGDAALQAVLDARESGGQFSSLYDFCERVPLRQLNKKTLETLVRSGAFDCFDRSRAQLMEALERAIDAARSIQKSAELGQGTLFGGSPELAEAVKPKEVYNEELPEWRELEKLKLEKDSIGFYLSGHPINRYRQDLARMANATVGSLERRDNGSEVVLGVVVTAIRERPLRDGSGRLAFVTMEDITGQIEAMASAEVWQNSEMVFKSDRPILAKLRVGKNTDMEGNTQLRLRILGARAIDDVRQERARAVVLRIKDEVVTERRLAALKEVFSEHQGPCGVRMVVQLPDTEVEMALPGSIQLAASDEMMDRVEQLFGHGSVQFQ